MTTEISNSTRFQETIREIERVEREKKDYLAPTDDLRFLAKDVDLFDLRVGRHSSPLRFGVNPHTHSQIASYTGIPKTYYDRMSTQAPLMLASNVNHWLASKQDHRLVRTLDGEVRAFLSSAYRIMDNYEVAVNLIGMLTEAKLEIVDLQLTKTKIYIKALIERYEDVAVTPGNHTRADDIVQAGVIFSNSEVGLGKIRVAPYLYRLICKNGAIAEDVGKSQIHLGQRLVGFDGDGGGGDKYGIKSDETRDAENKAMILGFRDVVLGITEGDLFPKLVEQMREATRVQTQTPLETVEVTTSALSLSPDEGESLLANLIDGGDLSLWGLSNAVTATAREVDSYDRRVEMETMGWSLLSRPAGEVLAQFSRN